MGSIPVPDRCTSSGNAAVIDNNIASEYNGTDKYIGCTALPLCLKYIWCVRIDLKETF